jgi:hypothetical protein
MRLLISCKLVGLADGDAAIFLCRAAAAVHFQIDTQTRTGLFLSPILSQCHSLEIGQRLKQDVYFL